VAGCGGVGFSKKYGRVIGQEDSDSSYCSFSNDGDVWTDNTTPTEIVAGRLSSKDILLVLSFDTTNKIVSLLTLNLAQSKIVYQKYFPPFYDTVGDLLIPQKVTRGQFISDTSYFIGTWG